MKNLLLSFLLFTALQSFAQSKLYESFNQDAELQAAFMKKDLSPFIEGNVTFICDTLEKEVDARALSALLQTYAQLPKNTQVRKASETNNGYVQTYGIYKGDDALKYVRFKLSQETGKLEEVMIEVNN